MEKQLIPKLRFPEFADEWKKTKLEEIVNVYDSLHQTPKSYSENGYPMIRVTDVNNGNLNLDKCLRVTESVFKEFTKKYKPKKNDIIISRVGTCGFTIILKTNDEVCLGQNTVLLQSKIDSVFLHSLIKTNTFQNQVNKKVVGSTQKTLSLKDLKKFNIKIPLSNKEQQKIASFLSDVDDKITKLTKKKDLLEQYKKGIMQKIFNQELRFKDDNGNEFPKWEVKKLCDLGVTLNGLTGKTKENFGSGKPYIQYKQIFDSSKINIEDCGFVEITPSDNQTKMQYGDVFFTTSSETPNEIGTASVLLDEAEEIYLNSFCFGFRVLQTVLYPSFSQFLFRSNNFRKKMIPLAQGSTRYNISKSSFLKLKVFLPSIEEQTKIANFLSDIDIKIEALNTKIENSKAFKKGLLQQMFV
ncbi:restriction endonuclease subunit S [Tenacibaculum crassostreae]|uniref:restriction endonuclease subunit S n=1 Tax=Tenacibaculum crassostreae TaxID=502683 RepID=UPI0038961FDF